MPRKFKKQRNTFIRDKVANAARRVEIEIGDAKQDAFLPQFKTKHWDNEANFSVRLKEDSYNGEHSEKDGVVEWRKGTKTARLYELEGDEDGGFEFEVEFAERPESNVVEYTIQSKEFDFFYQPALTPKEIAAGVHRPENVVGSYAVYHKTKRHNIAGGKEYRTGKAFHIYRPFAEDANGKREWCELRIEGDVMAVTVPPAFLDAAAYPVRVDPTFGYTSVGSALTILNIPVLCLHEAPSEDGNIVSISSYCRKSVSLATDLRHAIYSDDPADENTLLAQASTPTSVSSSPNWYTTNVSYSFSASTNYWLGFWMQNTSGNELFYFDVGSQSVRLRVLGATFPSWPDPFDHDSTDSDNIYSIYATYTPPSTDTSDSRGAELFGSIDINSSRPASLTGMPTPALTAAQVDDKVRLTWTYE